MAAMGRKRSRVVLATFASALAISVSTTGAFQATLPISNSLPLRSDTPFGVTNGDGYRQSKLCVAVDPEVFLKEHVDVRAPSALSHSLKGVTKVKRKLPPKIKVQSKSAAIPSSDALSKRQSPGTRAGLVTKTPSSALPVRKKKKRNPRQMSTMPGFKNGAMTGRQKAFQDGIKLLEEETGRKYVDTPEARKKRRQINGEAMYKTSASVPDSLVQFASEIHKVDRITPKEEIELGERTQEAIRLQSLHDDLTERLSRPPTDEEWCAAAGKINLEAISQAIEDGLEAKNKLVTANLRMVQGVVNLYIRNGLGGQYNAGDLMQEGIMVGLVSCARA